MMETIGKHTVMLVVALILTLLARWLKSDYLSNFFASNAILLGITVFTIHAAAVGILMSQLEILKQRTSGNFAGTIHEIRSSFKEAFVCLSAIMLGAIIINSLDNKLNPLYNMPYIEDICSFIIVFGVIALLSIVFDTVNAILICLEHPQK